ncbi:DUF6221 family protein [Streptosporangium sp. NPDC051022]|uniref:DUF6221 family protein n=1 Tax=Streptosporangium sp. NPDC051022 TaxID=3155752 RepID=UPI0034364BAA
MPGCIHVEARAIAQNYHLRKLGYVGTVQHEWDRRHIARHDPARVLREVGVKQKLLDQYERLLRAEEAHAAAKAELDADVEHENRTGVWAGEGLPSVRLQALRREDDYLTAMLSVLEGLVKAEAAVYSDHPDYRQEWKP